MACTHTATAVVREGLAACAMHALSVPIFSVADAAPVRASPCSP
jgi:hypothetical protein